MNEFSTENQGPIIETPESVMEESRTETLTSEPMKGVANFADKIKNGLVNKGNTKIKFFVLGGIALVLVIALLLIFLLGNGGYKKTVSSVFNLYTSEELDKAECVKALLNGFCSKEFSTILSCMEDSEIWDYMLSSYEESYDYLADKYGDDFDITVKIIDKEKLDSDDLKEEKKTLKTLGKSVIESIEDLEDYDRDDWEDAADGLDVSVSDVKKIIKNYQKIGETLKDVSVTDGYSLEISVTISGSEDEDTDEENMTVYKVNGHWISEVGLDALCRLAVSEID